MTLPRNLAEACKNYDFSYIAGWLNGRYNLSVGANTIRKILNPRFVKERELMESDLDFVKQKLEEVRIIFRYKSEKWKAICGILGLDNWPDATWKIWLMNRLEELGIVPKVSHGSSLPLEELYEYSKTASSKIFNTNLIPAPINATAEKVSGMNKRKKKS